MKRLRGSVPVVGCLLAVLVGLALPPVAVASPDTLRMALANVMGGPVDMAVAPVVAGRVLVHNAGEVGGRPVGPVAYGFLGSVGLTALQVAWGVLRTGSGVVMLVPGLVLFPFEGVDLPAEADVFGRGDALYVWKNPLAEDPPWLEYVLPATPATVDATLGIEVPYSRYPSMEGVGAVYPDEATQ
jgi:hypothetical protein